MEAFQTESHKNPNFDFKVPFRMIIVRASGSEKTNKSEPLYEYYIESKISPKFLKIEEGLEALLLYF